MVTGSFQRTMKCYFILINILYTILILILIFIIALGQKISYINCVLNIVQTIFVSLVGSFKAVDMKVFIDS